MIVRFLRWMEASARRGWMIYDLQRNAVPFYFIALAGALLRLHPVVVYDGRVSVARSLTRAEWQARIAEAGLGLERRRPALVHVPLRHRAAEMTAVETLIVGGGPAGAAAACGLAAAGREVMLVERSQGPHHKVCGEFLSIETQALLQALGVDPAALGAVEIGEVAVYAAGAERCRRAAVPRAVAVALPARPGAVAARGRGGAHIKRGVSVQHVSRDGADWNVRCDGGATIRCRHLVLATGKWGLRGIRGCARRLAGRIENAFAAGARPRSAPCKAAWNWRCSRAVMPGLSWWKTASPISAWCCRAPPSPGSRPAGRRCTPILARRCRISASGSPARRRCGTSRWRWSVLPPAICIATRRAAYRIGDRLAHIPPFTGDGLAIALGSAALAAGHIRQGRSPADYLAAARRLTGRPIRIASTLSGLAAHRGGRALLMGAAALAPGIIGALTRATRLPLAAH